jgi:preprotein translocase subunit SecG
MLIDLSNINTIDFYLTLLIVAVVVVLIVLLMRSGKGLSVQETQSHAEEFAGEVKEGHGGIPLFLWVLFIFFFVWTIFYFITHASEFGIIFSP